MVRMLGPQLTCNLPRARASARGSTLLRYCAVQSACDTGGGQGAGRGWGRSSQSVPQALAASGARVARGWRNNNKKHEAS